MLPMVSFRGPERTTSPQNQLSNQCLEDNYSKTIGLIWVVVVTYGAFGHLW
jgi:hypothetical protein